MKRLFPLLLCVGIVMLLCACVSAGQENASSNTSDKESNSKYVILNEDISEVYACEDNEHAQKKTSDVDKGEIVEQPKNDAVVEAELPEDDLDVYDMFVGKWYSEYDLTSSISLPKEMPVGSILMRSDDGTFVTLQINEGEYSGCYIIIRGDSVYVNHWEQMQYAPASIQTKLNSKQKTALVNGKTIDDGIVQSLTEDTTSSGADIVTGSYVRSAHSKDYTQEYMASVANIYQ